MSEKRPYLRDGLHKARSATHGDGVFTSLPIPAGAPVIEMTGRVIRYEEIAGDIRVMQIGPDAWLAEDETDALDNYANHSCAPNMGFVDGSLLHRALRDIAPGEELLWDYSTSMNEPGWELPCDCGAPGCRGRLQSFCDLPPEEQARLRPLALAYLR